MNRFNRRLLWVSTLLTALTGGIYAWMDLLLEPMNEWAVINHPLQPWVLKAHILVAPVMVFAVGMVAIPHVWSLYRSGLPRGRSTGIWTAVTFGPLVLTGYLIQAVTQETVLSALSWTHLGLGALITATFVGHRIAVWRGIRRRKGELRVVGITAVAAEEEGLSLRQAEARRRRLKSRREGAGPSAGRESPTREARTRESPTRATRSAEG